MRAIFLPESSQVRRRDNDFQKLFKSKRDVSFWKDTDPDLPDRKPSVYFVSRDEDMPHRKDKDFFFLCFAYTVFHPETRHFTNFIAVVSLYNSDFCYFAFGAVNKDDTDARRRSSRFCRDTVRKLSRISKSSLVIEALRKLSEQYRDYEW